MRLCPSLSLLGLITALVFAGPTTRRYQRPKPKSDLEILLGAPDAPPATVKKDAAKSKGAGSPFAGDGLRRKDARPGVVCLSNGKEFPGLIYTTRDKGYRVYITSEKRYRDIPASVVDSIEAVILWERVEDDWRWKEEGSDVKVFTGKKYPNRMTDYKFTLINGRTITGAINAPIWIDLAGKTRRVILHKRQKGDLDTTLAKLVYVKRVVFSEKKMRQVIGRLAATKPVTRRAPASRKGRG